MINCKVSLFEGLFNSFGKQHYLVWISEKFAMKKCKTYLGVADYLIFSF